MEQHEFVVGGGRTVDERNKANWPAILRFTMDRRQAWDVVQELMAQLRGEDNEVIAVDRCGELKPILPE